jgi:SAM-dependent methyltransferase
MKLDLHYVEPRLVDLYDLASTSSDDVYFYIQLALDIKARVIVDLGCGTGLITRALAIEGRQVIGVDPAPAMLAYARRQPGADRVKWVEGGGSAIGTPQADLAIMTGHVAQVFLEDEEWMQTLKAMRQALRSGGHLAFESRNPGAQAWERWNREATYRTYQTPHGEVEEWLEVKRVTPGRVAFEGHTIFSKTGEHLVVESELRFRSLAELSESLVKCGFGIENLYGDWKRAPVTETSPELIFVAVRE